MERLTALSLLLSALGAGVPAVSAQSAAPADQTSVRSEQRPKPRPVSPATAALLAATMPKYDPPKPEPPPKPEEVKEVDLRDVDKPKNGIIRLPKYVVHGEKPPIFREEDLYTKRGLTDLAMSRHPGLGLGLLGMFNGPIALEMYREDARLESMADLAETAHAMSRGGDDAEGQYIMRATEETYAHQMDFGGPVPGHGTAPK